MGVTNRCSSAESLRRREEQRICASNYVAISEAKGGKIEFQSENFFLSFALYSARRENEGETLPRNHKFAI